MPDDVRLDPTRRSEKQQIVLTSGEDHGSGLLAGNTLECTNMHKCVCYSNKHGCEKEAGVTLRCRSVR